MTLTPEEKVAIYNAAVSYERHELIEQVHALRVAGRAVVAAWETGDLAAAINELDAVLNATTENPLDCPGCPDRSAIEGRAP